MKFTHTYTYDTLFYFMLPYLQILVFYHIIYYFGLLFCDVNFYRLNNISYLDWLRQIMPESLPDCGIDYCLDSLMNLSDLLPLSSNSTSGALSKSSLSMPLQVTNASTTPSMSPLVATIATASTFSSVTAITTLSVSHPLTAVTTSSAFSKPTTVTTSSVSLPFTAGPTPLESLPLTVVTTSSVFPSLTGIATHSVSHPLTAATASLVSPLLTDDTTPLKSFPLTAVTSPSMSCRY